MQPPPHLPFQLVIEVRGKNMHRFPVRLFELLLIEVSEVEVDDVVIDVLAAFKGPVVVSTYTLAGKGDASDKEKNPEGISIHFKN